eukprot:109126-Rhodomonas_salina.1
MCVVRDVGCKRQVQVQMWTPGAAPSAFAFDLPQSPFQVDLHWHLRLRRDPAVSRPVLTFGERSHLSRSFTGKLLSLLTYGGRRRAADGADAVASPWQDGPRA